MKHITDEISQELSPQVRRMLEEEPPPNAGLWKLTESEMESLSVWLTGLIYRAHSCGRDDGYDSCLDHLTEGISVYMERNGGPSLKR